MKSMRVPCSEGRLACAVALGWTPPEGSAIEPVALAEHYRTGVEQIALQLTVRECIEFTLECAKRCLTRWKCFGAVDSAPHEAIAAVESWLVGCVDADFDGLARRAADAAHRLDYPEFTKDIDPARYKAMEAAEAAACAAYAVGHYLASDPHDDIQDAVGWCARSGIKCASNPAEEKEWQSAKFIELLTRDPMD